MKWQPILLVGLLTAATALAQGNFLYTWHGDSGLFQASFQVTQDENQPGASFGNSTFTSSITITSPDNSFHYTWPQDIAEGSFGPPLRVSITLDDDQAGRRLTALANNGWAVIGERDLATLNLLYAENGYWVASAVPEPTQWRFWRWG